MLYFVIGLFLIQSLLMFALYKELIRQGAEVIVLKIELEHLEREYRETVEGMLAINELQHGRIQSVETVLAQLVEDVNRSKSETDPFSTIKGSVH